MIDVDPDHPNQIKSFLEKPDTCAGLPDDPNTFLASMGNYVANTDALFDALSKDAKNEDTKHDMGGDIAPYFASRGEAGVYDFNSNVIPGADRHIIMLIGATWARSSSSTMRTWIVLSPTRPSSKPYNQAWPIYTNSGTLPPAKFVHAGRDRLGHATD